ncbi:MAG: hypothetical protein ACXABL_15030, partial [Candidatus Thorarchaeota archaeon]
DTRMDCQGVSIDMGREFARKYNADCVEVSAKSGVGVSEMFELAAKKLLEKYPLGISPIMKKTNLGD